MTVDGTVHEWKARVRHRARGAGCRICHGLFRVPSRAGSLLAVNPELAAEWDLSRNGDLTPRDVSPSSHRKVWWSHTGPGGGGPFVGGVRVEQVSRAWVPDL